MAILSSPLVSRTPRVIVSTKTEISHVQLRDLVICPRERGVVNYVQKDKIVEHNLHKPDDAPQTLCSLSFTPNTLTSLQLNDVDATLLAAGGQEADIHLSLQRNHTPSDSSRCMWERHHVLEGSSINNSVILTRSNQSSLEPRLGISNNDCSVKFFDIPLRATNGTVTGTKASWKEIGTVKLNVPVNHSSISPDGSTLISVGDSSKVHLHQLTGSSRLTFHPIAVLSLPPPDYTGLTASWAFSNPRSLAASFSTAFSGDGTKYAVASQEGVVAVWDVRSTKPLKIFQTDKSRIPVSRPNGAASGWTSDDPFDFEWARNSPKVPGWSVRCVKFGGGPNEHGFGGKETMVFTEHTSYFHVVDARTFETEEIVRIPSFPFSNSRPTSTDQSSEPSMSLSRFTSSYRPRPTPPSFVRALQDSFRISPSSNSSVHSDSSHDDADTQDILVIPGLGDREIENDVQMLLGHHGITSRRRLSLDDDTQDECITRSSSPWPMAIDSDSDSEPAQVDDHVDLDISGVCFDPLGGRIYVGCTEGISEYELRGADKRWWSGESGWV